ncbi:hypothetical protein SAMD00019534_048060 [Acytostelium subglobosum LB1]|uniref:hypothetical protein n=1 Tax=Acytostelium subglobosum LB1 TaxID=1410327 RepID=UPI0006447CDA|nr:hypothetical protein SAMD00019534_048060 [Acytostelium subglobosum LB1]GAM21631.1 hypothetical protein SAMD00019534_048060 [Acytostelium subglobosum LB1]|eukprot:XP_012755750.1 hypothetical protein SAMD00019534_048060 [Acytostelium subglobosum LB1]
MAAPDYSPSIYSGSRRYILLVFAELQILCICGVVFGWSALEQTMIKEGIFSDLCEAGQKTCSRQELRLNLIYTLGTFTATGSSLFSGALFDRYGPKLTNLCALVILSFGFLLWFLSSYLSEECYIVAFAIIGIGGPALQISIMHIGNLFPKYSCSICASFSGMYVVSGFVFRVFGIISDKYNVQVGILFLGYIGVMAILVVPTIIMMHNTSYLPLDEYKAALVRGRAPPDGTGISAINSDSNEESPLIPPADMSSKPLDDQSVKFDPYAKVKNKPLLKQLITWEFYLIVIYMSVISLHNTFYLGTINQLFDAKYVNIFNWAWEGGFIFVPLYSMLMYKCSLALNAAFVNAIGIVFGILCCIPNSTVNVIGFFFLSFQNVYLWGFHFVYLAQIFTYANFGTLLGIASVTVALFGLFEYLLVYLSLNGVSFLYINGFLTILRVTLFILPIKMLVHCRRKRKKFKNLYKQDDFCCQDCYTHTMATSTMTKCDSSVRNSDVLREIQETYLLQQQDIQQQQLHIQQ